MVAPAVRFESLLMLLYLSSKMSEGRFSDVWSWTLVGQRRLIAANVKGIVV